MASVIRYTGPVRAALASLAVISLLVLASPLRAQWNVPFVASTQLRIDGALGDWGGASWIRVGEDARGRAEIALAYDESTLLLAARVFDDDFVRSAQPSAAEDALVVQLELPGTQARRVELWLYAGQPGRTRAQAQLRAAASGRMAELPEVRVVEGPGTRGERYVLEAACPWSSVLPAASWGFARAQLRLQDVDAGAKPREIGSGGAQALAFERGPLPVLAAWLRERDLTQARALLDGLAQVQTETARVLVVGTFALLVHASGPLEYSDLPAAHAADVHAAELRDLTGDGLPELTVRLTTRDSAAVRELWLVYALGVGGPRRVFGVELRRERAGASLSASLAIDKPAPRERAPRIVVRAGSARNWSPTQELGPGLTDILPVPAPWSPWVERSYVWNGSSFGLQSEQKNRAPAPQPTATAPSAAPPAAAAGGEDTSALVDAYRAARDISRALQPRFVQRADIAEDGRPEELGLYDRECLVVGAGFRGGNDFFYFALPVQSSEQVLALFTADVTGDRRHEILARVQTQTAGIVRELLLVYTFHNGRFETVLTAEVARSDAGHGIENEVSVLPHQGKSALQIRPGRARGWTAASYPFRSDAQPGIAPLLLPWNDAERRYCYDGRQLVACIGSD